jgi:hypothetical protein
MDKSEELGKRLHGIILQAGAHCNLIGCCSDYTDEGNVTY